jgi:hypothetical protein
MVTYLGNFFVFLFDKFELVLHLVLKLDKERFTNIADSGFREFLNRSALGIAVELAKFLFENGGALLKVILEGFFELLIGVLLSSEALALANVRPGSLDVGDDASVDSLNVAASQVVQHVTREFLPMHELGFDPVDDLAPELHELLNKLRSEVVKVDLLQGLEIFLLGERANHGATVSLFEEGLEEAADAVLLFNAIRESLLWLEGLLEVLFGSNWLALLVNQLKREVSHNPHERREVLRVLLGVDFILAQALSLKVYVFCEVDDQGEVRESVLVDGAN